MSLLIVYLNRVRFSTHRQNKYLLNTMLFTSLCLLILCNPSLLYAAEGAIKFKPPAGDLSVFFLANLFGVVDGVLAGNGSQMSGQIFGVFNTAVLSLGGIIITYTLFVSTMNTAQQGQAIGQRWSSMLVPLRSVTGVALLLPKASGYCVMQIFIMWIVVQGIGAADKIWGEALSYLNKGGSIVSPNSNPLSTMKNNGNTDIYNGAYGMFVGAVCMNALEKGLINYQDNYKTTSTCTELTNPPTTGSMEETFCNSSVPSFIDTVDFLAKEYTSLSQVTIKMPSFSPSYPNYSHFNGVCGKIEYKNFALDEGSYSNMGFSTNDTDSLKISRAVALNQMFLFLAPVAEKVVANAPFFNPDGADCGTDSNTTACAVKNTAQYYWGVPLSIDLDYCTPSFNPYKNDGVTYHTSACLAWDLYQGKGGYVLLRGTEIQDAVATYNGMMSASLYVASQAAKSGNYKKQREFISKAEQTGWILAGAYYFKLAILTSQVLNRSKNVGSDDDSGLKVCSPNGGACGENKWTTDDFTSFFEDTTLSRMDSTLRPLFFTEYHSIANTQMTDLIANTIKLITGTTKPENEGKKIPEMSLSKIEKTVYNDTSNNATYLYPNSAYGFLINSSSVVMPGQPGKDTPNFVMKLTFSSTTNVPKLGNQKMSGGKWNIPGQVITFLFNNIIKHIINLVISLMLPVMNVIIYLTLLPPMSLLASTFLGAMSVLNDPAVNPILAIANMGVGFIEGSANSFIAMIAMFVGYGVFSFLLVMVIGPLGMLVFVLLFMLMPVVALWYGIMATVGISATFYVPMVPFTIFLFATIGWLIGVIEVMVAGPLLALGIMHPEGEKTFGAADQSVLLLLGIFLRPSMMILGYIFGIILTYVGIWYINAGFTMIVKEITTLPMIDLDTGQSITNAVSRGEDMNAYTDGTNNVDNAMSNATGAVDQGVQDIGQWMTGDATIYGMWSTIFLFFFMLMTYISTIIAVVNKSFELIHLLPDQIMRWISNRAADPLGQSSVDTMKGDLKQAESKAGSESSKGMAKGVSSIVSAMGKIADAAGAPKMLKNALSGATDDKKTDDDASATGGNDDDAGEEGKEGGTAKGGAGTEEATVTGGTHTGKKGIATGSTRKFSSKSAKSPPGSGGKKAKAKDKDAKKGKKVKGKSWLGRRMGKKNKLLEMNDAYENRKQRKAQKKQKAKSKKNKGRNLANNLWGVGKTKGSDIRRATGITAAVKQAGKDLSDTKTKAGEYIAETTAYKGAAAIVKGAASGAALLGKESGVTKRASQAGQVISRTRKAMGESKTYKGASNIAKGASSVAKSVSSTVAAPFNAGAKGISYGASAISNKAARTGASIERRTGIAAGVSGALTRAGAAHKSMKQAVGYASEKVEDGSDGVRSLFSGGIDSIRNTRIGKLFTNSDKTEALKELKNEIKSLKNDLKNARHDRNAKQGRQNRGTKLDIKIERLETIIEAKQTVADSFSSGFSYKNSYKTGFYKKEAVLTPEKKEWIQAKTNFREAKKEMNGTTRSQKRLIEKSKKLIKLEKSHSKTNNPSTLVQIKEIKVEIDNLQKKMAPVRTKLWDSQKKLRDARIKVYNSINDQKIEKGSSSNLSTGDESSDKASQN